MWFILLITHGLLSHQCWSEILPALFVSKDNLSVRSSCSISSGVVEMIGKGSDIVVVSSNVGDSINWLQISHPVHGWIEFGDGLYQNYVSLVSDCTSPKKIINQYLLAACQESGSWFEQWPIGTGEIGALVGGQTVSEIIPVSIADLYLANRNDYFITRSKSSNQEAIFSSFHEARIALQQTKFEVAEKLIRELTTGNEGKFEYVADIGLFYGRSNEVTPTQRRHEKDLTKRRLSLLSSVKSGSLGLNLFSKSTVNKPIPSPAQFDNSHVVTTKVKTATKSIVSPTVTASTERGSHANKPAVDGITVTAEGPSVLKPKPSAKPKAANKIMMKQHPNNGMPIMAQQAAARPKDTPRVTLAMPAGMKSQGGRNPIGLDFRSLLQGRDEAGQTANYMDTAFSASSTSRHASLMNLQTGHVRAVHLVTELPPPVLSALPLSLPLSLTSLNMSNISLASLVSGVTGSGSGSTVSGSSYSGGGGDSSRTAQSLRQTTYELHSRQWFASMVDNVLVGRMTCDVVSRTTGAHSKSQSCLNLGLHLSRGLKPDRDIPTVTYEVLPPVSRGSESSKNSRHLGVAIGPSDSAIIAHTYMCLNVECKRARHNGQQTSGGLDRDKSFPVLRNHSNSVAVLCEAGEEMLVYVSVVKESNEDTVTRAVDILVKQATAAAAAAAAATAGGAGSAPKTSMSGYSADVITQLSSQCWSRVNKAAAAGVTAVRERHEKLFAPKMSRLSMDISVPPSPDAVQFSQLQSTTQQAMSAVSGLMTAAASLFATPDKVDNTVSTNNQAVAVAHNKDDDGPVSDARLAMTMTQMSRYLLLTSAAKSANNLQGVWADGRTPMWSGDYHFNINMQMAYWASNVANLPETLPEMTNYIQHTMQARGNETAANYYKSKGWVAHGFTDGFSNMGLLGDYHWGLCVTCGAWMALALWDDFTFSYDNSADKVQHSILPVFAGVADFFLDYMHADINAKTIMVPGSYLNARPGLMTILHTGPTTSPETSYVVKKKKLSTVVQLSLSPAIDCSVLRQAAIAYKLAVDVVLASSAGAGADMHKHAVRADKFYKAVQRMPGNANPVVGLTSGRVLEYPAPFPDAVTDADSNQEASEFVVSEAVDAGHRHFSSLHFMYPSTFLPHSLTATAAASQPVKNTGGSSYAGSKKATELYEAVRATLMNKRADGGGHTSWSAVWEAALWARIGAGDEAWAALTRVINKYTTARLLSLHPPLQRIQTRKYGECKTCFQEKITEPMDKLVAGPNRGLVTKDRSAFQLDGNAGYLAAMCELLVQSHVPGFVMLLPALPAPLARLGGRMFGIRARGNMEVSVAWSGKAGRGKAQPNQHQHQQYSDMSSGSSQRDRRLQASSARDKFKINGMRHLNSNTKKPRPGDSTEDKGAVAAAAVSDEEAAVSAASRAGRVRAALVTITAYHPLYMSSNKFVKKQQINSQVGRRTTTATTTDIIEDTEQYSLQQAQRRQLQSSPGRSSVIGGLIEESPGYFVWNSAALTTSNNSSDIAIVYPYSRRPLALVASSTNSKGPFLGNSQGCAVEVVSAAAGQAGLSSNMAQLLPFYVTGSAAAAAGGVSAKASLVVRVTSYPCSLLLCVAGHKDDNNEYSTCKSLMNVT